MLYIKKLVRHAAKIPMIKCAFSAVGKQAKECICPNALCRSLVLVNFQYSLNYYCNLQQMILLYYSMDNSMDNIPITSQYLHDVFAIKRWLTLAPEICWSD